jgi:CheY-specific phosphatase CheX
MLVTEESIYEIVEGTWISTLGFQVERAEPSDFSVQNAITVCVKITGAWEGEVRLHCSPRLARLIAAAIFQVEADGVGTYEILDALTELIHIVGGNLKALLPQPVVVSLPSLLDQTDSIETSPQGPAICQMTLTCEGQPFAVSILGDSSAPARAENAARCESRQPAE